MYYVWRRNDGYVGCSCYKPADYDSYKLGELIDRTTFKTLKTFAVWEGMYGAAIYLNAVRHSLYWSSIYKPQVLAELAYCLLTQDRVGERYLTEMLEMLEMENKNGKH